MGVALRNTQKRECTQREAEKVGVYCKFALVPIRAEEIGGPRVLNSSAVAEE